jgi:hypothetical protein
MIMLPQLATSALVLTQKLEWRWPTALAQLEIS